MELGYVISVGVNLLGSDNQLSQRAGIIVTKTSVGQTTNPATNQQKQGGTQTLEGNK